MFVETNFEIIIPIRNAKNEEARMAITMIYICLGVISRTISKIAAAVPERAL